VATEEKKDNKRFGLKPAQLVRLGVIHEYLMGLYAEQEVIGQYTLTHAVQIAKPLLL